MESGGDGWAGMGVVAMTAANVSGAVGGVQTVLSKQRQGGGGECWGRGGDAQGCGAQQQATPCELLAPAPARQGEQCAAVDHHNLGDFDAHQKSFQTFVLRLGGISEPSKGRKCVLAAWRSCI